jgi:hypothetical protein
MPVNPGRQAGSSRGVSSTRDAAVAEVRVDVEMSHSHILP